MRSILTALFAIILAFGLCSCDVLKEEPETDAEGYVKDDKPHFVITVNQLVKYPHAEIIEKEVDCFDGNTIWINTNFMLHSRNVEKVEIVPMPGNPKYYNLKIKLNRRGKMLWTQSSIGFKHSKVAFLVDGVCYRVFSAQEPDENGEWVMIEGPFHKYLAKGIAHYAESNYKLFNPSNTDL